jgi:hypothetical protein
MPARILEKLKMKCVFVAEWDCPVETAEIPLEVCTVCLEARKIQSKHIKIKREIKSVEMLPPHIVETELEIPEIVTE